MRKGDSLRTLAVALAIYLIAGACALNSYRYQLNVDGISFISNAQKYLRGGFRDAMNGCWGPLYSWLLVPFLAFRVDPLISAKLLSLIIGAFTLVSARSLSYRFEISEETRDILLFSLIPITLHFSFSAISADLLIACTLLLYFALTFDDRYRQSPRWGFLAGALGAFSYLAKAYALPFFIAHFSTFNAFHYLRGSTEEAKRTVAHNLIMGLSVFAVVVGTWVGIISMKYHTLSIGAATRYIHAYYGPESRGHPMDYLGLLKPPDETAVSVYDDPCSIPMGSWNPLRSWKYFQHQVKLFLMNAAATILIYAKFSPVSIAIVAAYVLLCLFASNETVPMDKIVYPTVTFAIYSIGYLLIDVNERYFWVIDILLLLMAAQLLELSFRNDPFHARMKKVTTIFFALTFVMFPIDKLVYNRDTGADIYAFSKRLEDRYHLQGNIASNRNWSISLFLTYYLHGRYYGQPKSHSEAEELCAELERNKIDYYLVWGRDRNEPLLSSRYREITGGKMSGLKIYSLEERLRK
jgi:hypothetical protein